MTTRIRRLLTGLLTRYNQQASRTHTHDHGDRGRRIRRRARRGSLKSKPTAFDWPSYAQRAESLRLLHQSQILVDTTIITRDGFRQRVHWQVMAALCPKLMRASRVSYGDQNGLDKDRELCLPNHVSGSIALLLIECAYGEPKLSLNRSNLEQLYEVAVEYDISHALDICLDHARTILDVNNCIYLYLLGLKHKHHKLRRASYSMIRANFKLVLHVNKDFHLLDVNHLKQLLFDNRLKLNDDEEIAWLAIVRWQRGQCLGSRELTDLYNRMVCAHHDVQLIQWPGSVNQPRILTNSLADSRRAAPDRPTDDVNNNSQSVNRIPLRLALDFYSPADPIESSTHSHGSAHLGQRSTMNRSPLRRSAEELIRDPDGQRKVDESELWSLVKCLRFMRFKSLAAFEAIESADFIASSALLTELIKHMRVAYKLKHNLDLNEEEEKTFRAEQLKRYGNHQKSRAQRAMTSLMKLVRREPRDATGDNNYLQRNLVDAAEAEPQLRLPTNSLKDGEMRRATADSSLILAVDNLIGQRTLERADQPRVPVSVGLLMGGWQDGRLSNSIWAYDFVSDRWFKLNIRLPEARAFHASCSSPSRGHIYIFGGTNGHSILNSVLKLNLATDVYIGPRRRGGKSGAARRVPINETSSLGLIYKFKHLRSMNERRCHLSGVFHTDGRVYALGGHNGSQRLRSGEWYDSKSNQWHPIAEMTIARADAAACSHENKIFIAGGQISDQFIQSSVEFYKSSDNTWTFATPMIVPRMSFRMVSYKGQMLAIGGTNGSSNVDDWASVTRTVERYNQSSGSWSFCAPMITKRCSFGALQIGNKLLVMGGHGGRRRLKSCESLRIGHFSGHSSSSLLAMARFIQDRLQRSLETVEPRVLGHAGTSAKRIADEVPLATPNDMQANESNNASLHRLVSRAPQRVTNELLSNVARLGPMHHSRSAMKWVVRNKLPERRSGFSVVAVHQLRNAKDFTYYGSLKPQITSRGRQPETRRKAKRPSFIKRPGRWSRFKIIKRRKLVKRLKIALIITAVIVMMW